MILYAFCFEEKKITKYFGPSLIKHIAQIKLQECEMEIALIHVQQVLELGCKIEIEKLILESNTHCKKNKEQN